MRLSNSPKYSPNNSLPPAGKQVGEKMFMLEESKGRSDQAQQKRERQLTFMDETLKILIVDDDEVDRLSIKRAIKNAGICIEVKEAWDCESAIAILKQQKFDCVFLDYRLPDGDGLSLVKDVKHIGITVPLIVLTGQGDERTAVEVIRAGASDYISKTKISPDVISRSLRNAIRLHEAEMEAQKANEQLKQSQERYRLVVEGSNDGIWDWDLTTNQIYCNDRFHEITGLSPCNQPNTYEQFLDKLHPEDKQLIQTKLEAHLERNEEYHVELRLYDPSGKYHYCIARGKAQRDANGKACRIAGILSDITERKRAEEQERFLADASILLAASLDDKKILFNLAQLAVPYMADLCIVDMAAIGTVNRLTVVYGDPKEEELALKLQQCNPPQVNSSHPIIKVLRSGKPALCQEISDSLIFSATNDAEHLKIVDQMGFKSYMIVPLVVRGKTLGAISFISTQSGRHYESSDLALAEDLARRAALAVENAKVHHEAKEASENLRQAIVILGEQQQQLRILQHLTNLLNQRLTDLPELLRVMVGAVCDAIAGAQFCFIMLQNPQCNGLILTVTAGMDTEKLPLEDALTPKGGWLSQIFTSGNAQLIERDNINTNFPLAPFPAVIYAVPIDSVQQGRLGVLGVGNWEDNRAFDDEDRHLLAAVGEQAAIAIDNARMIKALEERESCLELQNNVLAQQNQELEQQRQQIQLKNLQLLEAARLKSEFLATMSHELRTPMNAVIGFSQVLLRQRNSQLTSHQADMVERILNNGKHLLMLINDILDLSKIDAGRLELKLEKFNLSHLLLKVTSDYRPLALQKQLELKLEVNLDDPFIINDSARLKQVFVNLLSNAIKFTEVGSVKVEVWEEPSEQIVIAIKDTGIGIEEKQINNIFEQFRQGDQRLNRKYDGTGLGLALTKSLLQLMQGEISVESKLGEGSTFRIKFPRRLSLSNYRLG